MTKKKRLHRIETKSLELQARPDDPRAIRRRAKMSSRPEWNMAKLDFLP
jgi:hypothetical protein